MFDLFNDQTHLQAVFSRLSVPEAVTVHQNIESALEALSLPSASLLTKLQAEGFATTDLSAGTNRAAAPNAAASVLQKHMKQVFMQLERLQEMLGGMSLSEQVTLRETFADSTKWLKLPSPALRKQMLEEGLVKLQVAQVPISAAPSPKAINVEQIREKLNSKLIATDTALTQQRKANAARQRLAAALSPTRELEPAANIEPLVKLYIV